MKAIIRLYIICLSFILPIGLRGQHASGKVVGYRHAAVIDQGDTIAVIALREVYIYPKRVFKSQKESDKYWKYVRDVKRTLPYAKMVYGTLIETYELMEKLPNDKYREKHLKKMEKDLYDEYVPVLKRFSYSQGKLLIRLIDRECNQSSYNLIKAFLGSGRAFFWNTFATLFGASLKAEWDPNGKDAELERICRQIEQGVL